MIPVPLPSWKGRSNRRRYASGLIPVALGYVLHLALAFQANIEIKGSTRQHFSTGAAELVLVGVVYLFAANLVRRGRDSGLSVIVILVAYGLAFVAGVNLTSHLGPFAQTLAHLTLVAVAFCLPTKFVVTDLVPVPANDA